MDCVVGDIHPRGGILTLAKRVAPLFQKRVTGGWGCAGCPGRQEDPPPGVSSGRDMDALAAMCEAVNAEHGKGAKGLPTPAGVQGEHTLFVQNSCGPSRAAMLARQNLHLESAVKLVNVSENAAAKEQLKAASGGTQVPCMVSGGKALLEAADIVKQLSSQATGL